MKIRERVTLAGVVGFVWALLVVWLGAAVINIPIFAFQPVLLTAFVGPGLVLALMVVSVSWQNSQGENSAGDDLPVEGSGAEIDARVLRDTVEQLVLALCLWPALGFLAADDGPGLLIALGASFPIARVAFWVGCHRSQALCQIGYVATLSATLLGLGWSFAIWVL